MAEKPVRSKHSEVRARALPATAKPVGVSSGHQLPRRGQSYLDPRWSGRLTLPPGPSLVSRSRPQSSSISPCRPILAILDIHRPPGGRNGKEVSTCEHRFTPCPWHSHEKHTLTHSFTEWPLSAPDRGDTADNGPNSPSEGAFSSTRRPSCAVRNSSVSSEYMASKGAN